MAITRSDVALLLGLSGFLLGGAAFYLSFRASNTVSGFASTIDQDGQTLDTLLNEARARNEVLAAANMRISALRDEMRLEIGDAGEALLRAANGLCAEGRPEGIEILIELADLKGRDVRRWTTAQAAGRRLNEISGKELWQEGPKSDPESAALAGSLRSAPGIRAWWDSVRKRIRFDAASGTWRTE